MAFHIVSRLHRREPWFVPELRSEVASLVVQMVTRSDAWLLAYAVMPNHLHVLLRQGSSKLGEVMQPLLRRVAHRVQRRHGFEGSVVERRFRDRMCRTPEHVRAAVMYLHLNPWRARLCEDDLDYPWTTHAAYLPASNPGSLGVDLDSQLAVLDLFALGVNRSRAELCRDYLFWLRWRMDEDKRQRTNAGGDVESVAPSSPDPRIGNRNWRASFGLLVPPGTDRDHAAEARPDLRDFLLRRVSMLTPGITLEELRGSRLPRQLARQRRQILRAAATHGYRTGTIAEFFDISPGTVSKAKYSAP